MTFVASIGEKGTDMKIEVNLRRQRGVVAANFVRDRDRNGQPQDDFHTVKYCTHVAARRSTYIAITQFEIRRPDTVFPTPR